MTWAAELAADRRLLILRHLADAPGYSANEALLRQVLARLGHNVSADLLRGDLAWLAEQGLAAVEAVAGLSVARPPERGADVAAGRALHPGVKRPGPLEA
jgi:hypothetical protein